MYVEKISGASLGLGEDCVAVISGVAVYLAHLANTISEYCYNTLISARDDIRCQCTAPSTLWCTLNLVLRCKFAIYQAGDTQPLTCSTLPRRSNYRQLIKNEHV